MSIKNNPFVNGRTENVNRESQNKMVAGYEHWNSQCNKISSHFRKLPTACILPCLTLVSNAVFIGKQLTLYFENCKTNDDLEGLL